MFLSGYVGCLLRFGGVLEGEGLFLHMVVIKQLKRPKQTAQGRKSLIVRVLLQ